MKIRRALTPGVYFASCKTIPGLKLGSFFFAFFGTAEAVPFQTNILAYLEMRLPRGALRVTTVKHR
jgi:hypothetical protein